VFDEVVAHPLIHETPVSKETTTVIFHAFFAMVEDRKEPIIDLLFMDALYFTNMKPL
jgi:hypothetical protein